MLDGGAATGEIRQGHSGGSTGSPTGFYDDTAEHERMLVGMQRGFVMSGRRPGLRALYLLWTARDVAGFGVCVRAGRGRHRFAIGLTA